MSSLASYYFDGQGKSIRPQIVRLVSEALDGEMNEKSFKIGMIAEMIHTASLIHDDVIDKSDMRYWWLFLLVEKNPTSERLTF